MARRCTGCSSAVQVNVLHMQVMGFTPPQEEIKMKIIALLTVGALAASVPALAQSDAAARGGATTRADVQARVARMFAATDANRDGFITQAEATVRGAQAGRRQGGGGRQADHAKRMDEHFAELDADRNGSISRAEFDAQHAGGRENRAERRAERTERRAERMQRRNASGIAMRPRQFERSDANKDGRLTLAEASTRPLARFAQADANGDGTLTREERRAAREKMQAQRQQRRAS